MSAWGVAGDETGGGRVTGRPFVGIRNFGAQDGTLEAGLGPMQDRKDVFLVRPKLVVEGHSYR